MLAALRRVLPDSLPLLAGPAEASEIDAIEVALGVTLAPDFRASLRIHNGSNYGNPTPVPLEYLFQHRRYRRDNAGMADRRRAAP